MRADQDRGPDRARREMVAEYAERLGVPLEPTLIALQSGDVVLLDGASADGRLLVLAVSGTDPTSEGRRAAVGQALLTLALVRRGSPGATTVLLVAGEDMRRSALAWVPSLALAETPALQVAAC